MSEAKVRWTVTVLRDGKRHRFGGPYSFRSDALIAAAKIREDGDARLVKLTRRAKGWRELVPRKEPDHVVLVALFPIGSQRRETALFKDGKWVASWSHEEMRTTPTHWRELPAGPK